MQSDELPKAPPKSRSGPDVNRQPPIIMSSKQTFNLIRLNICGNTFIAPRDAGMAVFNLFANHDVYHQRYEWVSGGDSYQYAALVEEGAVKLESIGPVEFVKLRAEAEAREQRLAAERKAKAEAERKAKETA